MISIDGVVAKLRPQTGDVIVVHGLSFETAMVAAKTLREMLRDRFGVEVVVAAVNDSTSIELLDEAAMREAGWQRIPT